MKTFSIIITCVNETTSLIKTLDIIKSENDTSIDEIIIVYPEFIDSKTKNIADNLSKSYKKIKLLKQTRPHVGGAVQDAFDIVGGDYTIMMASDLETDPHDVKTMISVIQNDSSVDVVTASRWKDGGDFSGYGANRVIYNYCFNKLFAFLYSTKLTDMTFGYRCFRTTLIKKIKWENYKHSFFFETIIKPLNMGCKVKEIKTKWVARDDGGPVISRDYFNFIVIGIKNKVFTNQ